MLLQTWKVVTGNSLGSSLERSSSVLFVGHEWWRKLLWVGRRRIVCYQVESVSCCESCCRTRQLLCVIWESTFAQWEDAVLLKVVVALKCLHHGQPCEQLLAYCSIFIVITFTSGLGYCATCPTLRPWELLVWLFIVCCFCYYYYFCCCWYYECRGYINTVVKISLVTCLRVFERVNVTKRRWSIGAFHY